MAFLARAVMWILTPIHGVVHDWGWAIVVLAVVERLLWIVPEWWLESRTRSMKSVCSEIEAIKLRHPGDKQRQNQEVMALYRQHDVPSSWGCLPALLMLAFNIVLMIGVYGALRSASELAAAPFLWISSLGAPDRPTALVFCGSVVVRKLSAPRDGDHSTASPLRRWGASWGLSIALCLLSFVVPAGFVLRFLTTEERVKYTRVDRARPVAARDRLHQVRR